MTWFKVDDGFYDHPKVVGLSLSVRGLWLTSGTYCARHLTDGHITRKQARRLGGNVALVRSLIDSGLWIDCPEHEGCCVFSDWNDYQLSRDSVQKRRKDEAEKKRKARERKALDQRVNQNVPRGQVGESLGESALPDPTRPDPTSLSTYFGGEGHVSRRASDDAAPPGNLDPNNPRCPTHAHVAADDRGPNCRACKAHREWLEGEPERRRSEIVELNRLAKTLERECPMCDGGWLLADDGTPVEPAVRCDHERRTA